MKYLAEPDQRRWIQRILSTRRHAASNGRAARTSDDPDRVAVVVAHPDDESVGCGGHLPALRDAAFLFVTDGAPHNMTDAWAAGFDARATYAQARFEELCAALEIAGIDSSQASFVDMVDQEACRELTTLTRCVAEFIRDADVVITHPYEGGHPDHDACAFAVQYARELLQREQGRAPIAVEMTSYHSRGGTMAVGQFLDDDQTCIRFELNTQQCDLKERLLACYATQQRILQHIPVGAECFRPAPRYDFARPPHDGLLLYEIFDFGISGAEWRRLATESARDLVAGSGARTMNDLAVGRRLA